MNKLIPIFSFIISGLLLITYPFVFIAGIMSLAAVGTGSFDANTLVAILFLSTSMLYPITYFISLMVYILKKTKSTNLKIWLICAPYIHLGLTISFFIAWTALG